jgi:hypothetical protein
VSIKYYFILPFHFHAFMTSDVTGGLFLGSSKKPNSFITDKTRPMGISTTDIAKLDSNLYRMDGRI